MGGMGEQAMKRAIFALYKTIRTSVLRKSVFIKSAQLQAEQ